MASPPPKNQVKSRNSIEQSEHEDNASARRVVNVDSSGNFHTIDNPFEVHDKQANIKLLSQLLSNANFLKLANFTRIVPSFVNQFAYYDYYEIDARIARVTIRYIDDTDWDITLERFINNANGDELLDDDGSFLNLS